MEVVVREIDIRPGNAAMYYPEANILVPRRIDPESKTPPAGPGVPTGFAPRRLRRRGFTCA
jgi:hypothetical protein